MNPVNPMTIDEMHATSPMCIAEKPRVSPVWAAYITVTRPSSEPTIVAIPSADLSDRPATR